ncbi:MAG TPA: carbohydrate ABC transporter permease [Ardenticatenaceae bacterium]|nr:carbohydrate ABC transporter permease [Ardenticatenaceae bacterium]
MATLSAERPVERSRRAGDTLAGAGRIAAIAVLLVAVLLALIPFLWMISTSLKTRAEVFAYPPILIPDEPRWENYVRVFQAFPFMRYAFNTAFIAVTVTFFHTLTSALAAYTFARLRFPGRDKLFLLYLATLMLPGLVTLIPTYIMMTDRFLGWVNTYWALIVPPSLGGVFSTFLLRQFFLSLPADLDDAALIDGASPVQIFARITLPLAKSALAIVAVLTFMARWNDFLWPLLMIQTPENQTLTLGLAAMQGRWGTRWPELMAGTLMSIIPILILLILFQRYFEEGVAVTGMKA